MKVVHPHTWPRVAVVAALPAALVSASAALAGENPFGDDIRAFKPEADTYISESAPGRNFGNLKVLRADGSPRATVYLRFRVKKLKKDADVTLLLHPLRGAPVSYQVRRVTGVWRERRLTYRNAPRASLRYASSKPVRKGTWSAVDVTPFFDGDAVVSLAITTRSPFGVAFASRESKKHGPRLVVRTDDESAGDALIEP